jgi:PadR family transcriptional regulator PadR
MYLTPMGFTKSTNQNDFLPGTLAMLVLQTLKRGSMHGYGIAQYIRQRSEEVLHVGEGSLYPALQRLQVSGLVTAEWRESDTGRRARYYSLTPLGRKQLKMEVESYERVSRAIALVLEPALGWGTP